MLKEFWTVTEVVEIFEIDEGLLDQLEEEEIVRSVRREKPPTRLFSASELEKLRLVKILLEDMGVNLPGVEVVLRMRKNMIEMRKQFDAILEDLAQQVQEQLNKGS